MKKAFFPVIAGALFSIILLGGMWLFFQKSTEGIDLQEAGTQKKYERHYVMIAEDAASTLWQEIYKSAAQEAEDSDVYLELVDSDAMAEYTLEDFLRISIASKVDGIIMQPNGSEQGRKLIHEAAQNKIPVVTALEDDSESERISFVGMNSYQMGSAYGEAILKNLEEEDTNVLVLIGSDKRDTGTSIIVSQLMNDVREKTENVNISLYNINTDGNFELEEAIRDVFVNQKELPDLLVCLDEMITECAYQAIVDYNQVGNVDIIGYYESDNVLDSIKKGTIASTISFSTDEIGRYSVNALNEYHLLGHVSNYFNVTLRTINVGNVVSVMMNKEK
ncbi:MAG: substrate-binding domain-containing protein [Eubacteriales bacterium]|nr:substrate-binding domain-containing protein [Eubacteriales bacterium]